MEQITNTILMIRPTHHFRMNEQTAINNYYQKKITGISQEELQLLAQQEFDIFVEKLKNVGINVLVFIAADKLDTPDAHFPNNWISFHKKGTICLYPMFAENRRLERREDILFKLEKEGFRIDNIVDYTSAEEEHLFLEGTGSLLLDRVNRKAYCVLSARADESLLIEFCEDFEYTPIMFSANQTVDGERLSIYHTNVMMCLGKTFAVICLDSIDDNKECKNVVKHLRDDNKEIITITENQVNHFAGNMLQVKGKDNDSYIIMSQVAYNSLSNTQITILEKHGKILYSSLNIIEACGGGSARCMMAEVFLPKAN